MKNFSLTLLIALLFAGCGNDEQTTPPLQDAGSDLADSSDLDVVDASDTGADAGVDPFAPGLSRSPTQQGVSPDGATNIDAELADEARVGRYETPPFTGLWAHCRPGDFKLYNDLIEVCVQAETSNRLEVFTGGMIVDVKKIGDDREDVFDMFKPLIGFSVQFAEKVEVVRDGTDGGPAVIRVTGFDTPVAYLVGIVGDLLNPEDLQLETEYRLWPGSTEVEVVTWVKNDKEFADSPKLGDWFAPGDRSLRFRQGRGLKTQSALPFDWFSTFSDGPNVGYLAERETSIQDLPFSAANPWLLVDLGNEQIEPGGEAVYRRWLSIGDGTLNDAIKPILKRLDQSTDDLELSIVDTAGDAQTGLVVEILDGDDAVAADVTDSNGAVRVAAPAGMYTLRVQAPLDADPYEIDAELSDGASVEIPTLGRLELSADEDGSPVTALAKVIGESARGEFFVVEGNGAIDLAPGQYTVVVSRGMEYDLEEFQVEITASQTSVESVTLERVVDTAGWIAADFHQHMEPSSDSDVSVRNRVLDNVAEGVEFVTSTDHDVLTDLQPWIDELGLQNAISTMPGTEISPTAAHVGIYPLPYDPTVRANGAVMLATRDDDGTVTKRSIPDVIAIARQKSTNPLIQLNHPRGGTSLFETARYEPTMDPASVQHEDWSTDFDTIEIVNRVSSSCAIMADWSTFLNTGYRLTGLGNSDSHRVVGGDPAGVPRNYLVSDSEPGAITDDEVVEALRNQRVTVASHAFIQFSDGKMPGDLIETSPSTQVDFGIQVQTPSWSDATRLHVIANGGVIDSLDANPQGGFDFDTTYSASFDSDTWVVFVAIGPRPNTASDYGGVTLAFTNPIYVDVDGDTDNDQNAFEAPGILPVDLAAINESGWCD